MVVSKIDAVVFVAFVVTILSPLSSANNGVAREPSGCVWVDNDAIRCHIEALDDQFGVWLSDQTWPLYNESVTIPGYRDASRIRTLSVVCNGSTGSHIGSNTFKNLNKISRFEAHNCNLPGINEDLRNLLPTLRILIITNTRKENQNTTLVIEKSSLPLQLETIDLSSTNVKNIHPQIFCDLRSLLTLNLSDNNLNNIENFGYASSNDSVYPKASHLNASIRKASNSDYHASSQSVSSSKIVEESCSSPLQSLVLNDNKFTGIPANTFLSFKGLKYLSLARNEIRFISKESLRGLDSLRVVDLSGNHIRSLENGTFRSTTNLQKIILSNNSITSLSSDLFGGLKELQILDLSRNNFTLEDAKTFLGLRRLVILNLSRNFLRFVEPLLFQDLSALQILDLSHTGIEGIQLGTFSNMYNLYELDLSHNRISTLSRESFAGLAGLNTLNLHNNSLSRIDASLLQHSANLKNIILSRNHFEEIPKAIENLSFLKHIDMGYNKLMTVEPFDFRGLRTLHNLHLSGNIISNLTLESFSGLTSLRFLNLSENNMVFASENSLRNIKDLQTLDLSRNKLASMDGLFAAMENLQTLNLAENQISRFDYSFLPKQLLTLSLSRNRITRLGNYFKVHGVLALEEIDVSFNNLDSLSEESLPDSIKILKLQENNIQEVKPGTLRDKLNVKLVNLRMNQIKKLNPKSISPKRVSQDQEESTVLLGGNPLLCDCDMKWLHVASSRRDHTSDSYGADYVLPVIGDPSDVLCILPHSAGNITRYSKVIDTSPEDFLCPYAKHCFALCHCCDFIACDCRMKCPASCSCYHDDTWKMNLVDCSRGSLSKLPDTVPMDATAVLLDGNDLKVLQAHQFIGRHSIQKLYLNQSNIQTLHNRTFHGLAALQELHLQNNMIVKLNGFEFFGLSHLKKLYLQNNRISFLSNSTFRALKTLEILRIDNNYIVNFPVWLLADNKLLKGLTLFNNPWDCDCAFVEELKVWASSQTQLIPRSSELFCVENDDVIQSISRPDFECTHSDDGVTPYQLGAYELPLLAGGLCGIVLLTTILIVVAMFLAKRKAVKAQKLGYSSSSFHNDDEGRVFDAFICYNLQDITFIRELTDKLERESPSYKLCLLHRDQADSLTMMDFIVQSICFSKRVIVLLSRNFIENEWQNPLFRRNIIDNMQNRENALIFITVEAVPEFEMELDLKVLLKRSSRIKWSDKSIWKRLLDLLPRKTMYAGFPVFITDPSFKSPVPYMDMGRTNELPSSSSVLTATTGLPTPSEAGRSSLLQDCPISYKTQSRSVPPTSPSDYIYMNHRESSRVPYDYHGTSRKYLDGDSSSVHTYNSLEILANQRDSAYGETASSPESHQYSLITPPKYYASKGPLRDGEIRNLPNHLPLHTSTASESADIYEDEVSFNPYGSFRRPVRLNTDISCSDSSSSSSFKHEELLQNQQVNSLSVLKSEECFV